MLDKNHAALLGLLANKGAISRKESKKIYADICKKLDAGNPNESEFEKAVNTINSEISRFDQRITTFDYTLEGAEESYLVFGLTSESEIDLKQTNYAKQEVEYFQTLLNSIIETEELGLDSIRALNLAGGVVSKQVTKQNAEKLIEHWTAIGYFKNFNGWIYFGPRTLVEFSTYFRQNFADKMSSCEICKGAVFWGTKCSSCETPLHKACIEKYLSRTKQCPKCKATWMDVD